ncbi:VOC family protein [Oscillatoria sp. FACHB-1407]|uniref:VOC family protein n=1 Tax=Oscillatoria sp. FACHB-1407 TaxID=2692847 RepID=UPI001686776A|nr:VOC family protein [Oscillatoria sp. FACHB-1407]MBD2463629.1 VOC family protein [Oscillatoria sp. FACHB-1407]
MLTKKLLSAIALSALAIGSLAIHSVAQQSQQPSIQDSTRSPVSLEIHHMTVSVADVEAASQWYSEKLGFTETKRVVLDNGNVQIAWMEIPGFRIDLAQVQGSGRPEEQNALPPQHMLSQGWRHLAFAVDDVDRAYEALSDRGVEFISPPATYDPPGIRIVYFKDIDGNILELYSDF